MSDHKHVGRMSNKELDYIKSNASIRSYVEIAADLNREPSGIKKAMLKMGLKPDLSVKQFNVMYVAEIENKEFWPSLKNQFTEDELKIFKFQWQRIHDQFKSDVLPTEELQIIDTIKLDILMKRNLDEQFKSTKELRLLEDEYASEMAKEKGPETYARIDNLSHQIISLRTSQSAQTRDYKELLERKNKMFESLKATRGDRIKRIESSRESFFSWLAEIVNDAELRRSFNIQMEKFRLATINEEVRLAAYHKYEDGMLDQPLLNPETVK